MGKNRQDRKLSTQTSEDVRQLTRQLHEQQRTIKELSKQIQKFKAAPSAAGDLATSLAELEQARRRISELERQVALNKLTTATLQRSLQEVEIDKPYAALILGGEIIAAWNKQGHPTGSWSFFNANVHGLRLLAGVFSVAMRSLDRSDASRVMAHVLCQLRYPDTTGEQLDMMLHQVRVLMEGTSAEAA